MSSYFDEHNCTPLEDGQTPDGALHLARLLIDGGYAREWQLQYEGLFGNGRAAPPASKQVVRELPSFRVSSKQCDEEMRCPVCLLEYNKDEEVLKMPCNHHFHQSCLKPWLERTNSCPVCRFELLTDDEMYEDYKKQKAREAQRKFELENLHDSMFG